MDSSGDSFLSTAFVLDRGIALKNVPTRFFLFAVEHGSEENWRSAHLRTKYIIILNGLQVKFCVRPSLQCERVVHIVVHILSFQCGIDEFTLNYIINIQNVRLNDKS